MITVNSLFDGVIRVTDSTGEGPAPAHIYQWHRDTGWRMWVATSSVAAGGYWRAFTAENTVLVLDKIREGVQELPEAGKK